MHPDTACNTHDLLECGCDLDLPQDHLISTEEGRKEDNNMLKGFVSASDIQAEDLDANEKAVSPFTLSRDDSKYLMRNTQYLHKKKEALASLGEWKHINCLKPPGANGHIHDDILRKIVTSSSEKDAKKGKEPTRLETILSGMDIETIQEMIERGSAKRDAGGGAVSFLFEKCSNMDLKEVNDDVEE